ncbi:MAG: hypothetical protein U0524_03740 [Candidatus Saccharimonadales bacterium]
MHRAVLIALLIFSTIAVSTPVAHGAYTGAYGGVNCSDAPKSAVCQGKSTKDPLTGNGGLLIKITNLIAYVAGAAAVIMIIISGIRFITANGDANAVSGARSTLIGALIGLAIIALARTLINFVIMRL